MKKFKEACWAVWGAVWYGAVFSTMWMLTSKLFKALGWIQ